MIDSNGYIRCDCMYSKILARVKDGEIVFRCRGCKHEYTIPLQELIDADSTNIKDNYKTT